MSYRLLLYSRIPVVRAGGRFASLPLWVRDLEAQMSVVSTATLICPVHEKEGNDTLAPLPEPLAVVTAPNRLTVGGARAIVRGYDVVQVPGNFPWWESGEARSLLKAARAEGALGIVGISSNRAKATLMNRKGSPLRVDRLARAAATAASIALSQSELVRLADGVFVVGEGLRSLRALRRAEPYVETASWIAPGDIIGTTELETRLETRRAAGGPLRLCVAARLEPMKGVDVAIDAMASLQREPGAAAAHLLVLGEGPARSELEALAAKRGVGELVRFGGTRAYPEEFFKELRRQDLLLLTNLNDEQPRVLFDAASQGVPAACPETAPYRSIGTAPELLYRRGDPHALAATIRNFLDFGVLSEAARRARRLALDRTIDAMHAKRATWILSLLDAKRCS